MRERDEAKRENDWERINGELLAERDAAIARAESRDEECAHYLKERNRFLLERDKAEARISELEQEKAASRAECESIAAVLAEKKTEEGK